MRFRDPYMAESSLVSCILLGEVGKLPQKVSCHHCGHVLYQGEELKSPEEILQANEGTCPKCGAKLSLAPLNINVEATSHKSFIKMSR